MKHYQPEVDEVKTSIPGFELAKGEARNVGLMIEQRGVVIAVGPACWPDEPPRAKPGDKVLISRMAGHLAKGPLDGEQYVMVNDRDIFTQLVEEEYDV